MPSPPIGTGTGTRTEKLTILMFDPKKLNYIMVETKTKEKVIPPRGRK
jgi:hypothetical protein